MFQNMGNSAYKANLNNIIALSDALNNPQNKIQTIHVAGTNGKGSVSSAIASILTANGYKTGLFTSPHLKDFRERIRINGEKISESYVIEFTEKIKQFIPELEPSFFEISTAMAFAYFDDSKVDIAIIETGMGGRLDSTNIIHPILSIITNIGFDHMEFLGTTKTAIAGEKAGIIKESTPVIVSEYDSETAPVFTQVASEKNAELIFAESAPEEWISAFALKGNYQRKNLGAVYTAFKKLMGLGFELKEEQSEMALKNVTQLSGLRGRWEVIGTNPIIVADTAHNEHGIKLVISQVLEQPYKNLHIVLGMVKEKNLEKILPLFPADAHYYFCKPQVFRGLDEQLLKEAANAFSLKGEAYTSPQMALEAAKNQAGTDDFIYCGGSTFVVADLIPDEINSSYSEV